MKIRILPPASTAVVILATATTSVGGFSTNTPVLSGGWRTGNSYGRLVGNGGSTCQRMPIGPLQNQMDESSGGEADESETTTEKEDVTIVDEAEAEEEETTTTKEEEDLAKVRQLLSNDATTDAIDDATDEVEEVVDIDGAGEEEEEEDKTEEKATTSDSVAAPVFFASAQDEAATQNEDDSKKESEPEVQGLNLDTVKDVAGKIAADAFSILRFTAANVLTKSLPDEQRDDLLGRLGASVTTVQSSPVTDEAAVAAAAKEMANKRLQQERNSIQEEIAAARAEESQMSEKKWQREKEEILSQMEEAANARVENELKIQKMKLEEETANALKEKERALEAEKEKLEQEIQKEAQRVEALKSKVEEEARAKEEEELAKAKEEEEKLEVEALFAVRPDEEEARNKELEALLQKQQEDQAALEAVEKELLATIANEEKQRDLLDSMLEKRQLQQEKLDTVEANLRAQIKEVDQERDRYQKLVADLETMKKQEWKAEDQQLSEDSSEKETDADSEEELENPVLGPVIADLGYKRIHFVSSGRLGTIPVWNRNRTYRNNRAKGMAIEKAKSMELGFPGVICLHEAPNGKLSIIDGQHRVGMMTTLKQTFNKKNKNDEDIPDALNDAMFERVLVEVYPEPGNEEDGAVKNSRFAEKVFLEINKAEPVKLIDMPGVASKADRQIITEGVFAIKEEFKNMFSDSQRCRTPNVNEDNLRGMIFGANILKRHKLTTSKKLTEWLLKQNKIIGEEYKNDESKQELVSKKQWLKASENKFYLGLESSWLYK